MLSFAVHHDADFSKCSASHVYLQDFTFLNINLTTSEDVNIVVWKFNLWHHHELVVGSGRKFDVSGRITENLFIFIYL